MDSITHEEGMKGWGMMLQEIKEDFKQGIKVAGEGQGYTNLDDEQIKWLIKAAEKNEKYQKALELFATERSVGNPLSKEQYEALLALNDNVK